MKRVLAIILAAVLLLGVMPVVSFATNIVDSGTCGENLTWTLDDEGTLTISGTGEMRNYVPNALVILYGSTRSAKTVIIEDGVTSIGNYAFHNCSQLSSVTIPNSVTSIGDYAFNNCSSLTSVTIPNSVTSIGDYAFNKCNNLNSATIGNGVSRIGSKVFYQCSDRLYIQCYKNTVIPSYAEENSFAYGLLDGTVEENTISGTVGRLNWTIDRLNCMLTIDCIGVMPTFSSDPPWKALKNYVHRTIIMDGTSSISNGAFRDCNAMTEIAIANSVTSIQGNAFDHCSLLRNVTIPDTVTIIQGAAFQMCDSLTSITIPNGVLSISDYTFNCCRSLTSVTIPDSVTSLGESAFYGCSSLSTITIPNHVTSIKKYAFRECTNMESVIIPESVITIAEKAFDNCVNLKSLTISSGVKQIDRESFAKCASLISVEIPVSVNSVKPGAFANCTALESVYFYNPNCTISAGATPANATVYGYSGSTAETYADQNGLRFMEIDGHEHHFTVTKTVEPTCTEDGYKNLSCPCGERTTETIPSNGHTEVIVPAKEATCTERGYAEWSYCEVCGETLTEKVETEAKDHTPVTTGAYAATCGKNGFTGVTYCTKCKEVLDAGEPIPATNEHTPGEALEIIVAAATCTEAGASKTIVKCSACGETLSETTKTIAALGHTDGNGDEKCDRCNADMPKSADATKKSNVFDFLIQFFKSLADFFKRLFK